MKRIILLAACASLAVAAALASTGATAATKAPGLDQEYLTTSIQGDRFEIDGGKMAEAKGQNAAIKALGARLVKDHSKSLRDAQKLARKLSIKIPSSPTPPEQWELQVVSGSSGASFDKLYSSLEVADHKQDIEDATHEKDMGSNSAVRADARTELPVLKKHLQLSRNAMRTVGG